MIDFIIQKIPLIIFCILTIFIFFLQIYHSKLLKVQISSSRCEKNVDFIAKKIKFISTLLSLLKILQLIIILFYISSSKKAQNFIINNFNKLNNISIIKYVMYVLVFTLFCLMLIPLGDIKDTCFDQKIGKNLFYFVINWICISIIVILCILMIVKKFKNVKNNNYSDDDDDFLDYDFN